MAVAVREATEEGFAAAMSPVCLLAQSSLNELAVTINREHGLTRRSIESALDHAIACGHALLAAQVQVGRNAGWGAWIRDNVSCVGWRTAHRYMRLAAFEAEVRSCGAEGIYEGLRILGSLDLRRGRDTLEERPEIAEVRAAYAEGGVTQTQIAADYGVTQTTISNWIRPDYTVKRRNYKAAWDKRRGAERDALREKERTRAAKRAGVSEQWAALHVLGEQMDAIGHGTGATPEIRAAFRAALVDIYRARDKISKVLGAA